LVTWSFGLVTWSFGLVTWSFGLVHLVIWFGLILAQLKCFYESVTSISNHYNLVNLQTEQKVVQSISNQFNQSQTSSTHCYNFSNHSSFPTKEKSSTFSCARVRINSLTWKKKHKKRIEALKVNSQRRV
jgi:hypothetical protein